MGADNTKAEPWSATQCHAVLSEQMAGIWGPGSNANRETMSPKSCLIIKATPASFPIFPLHLVNTNSAFTNGSTTPGHGHPMNATESGPKFGQCCWWAPAAGRVTLKAVPGTAGTHPRSQLLWLDSIKAFTASDMTASDLQWQLIKRNYTPLLWKAATQNSFRDYTYLNKRKTLGFNKSS